MITFDVFLVGLVIVSTLTSLVTEAVKAILTEYDRKVHPNTLAGIVSAALSVAIGVGYAVIAKTGFGAQVIVYIIALVFLSWLCAMVGYDKVIKQLKNIKKG